MYGPASGQKEDGPASGQEDEPRAEVICSPVWLVSPVLTSLETEDGPAAGQEEEPQDAPPTAAAVRMPIFTTFIFFFGRRID